MTWLITLLRTKVNDTDESIWTDDQLENYLDMHRVHVRREPLTKDVDERVYCSKFGMFEDDVILWDSDSANATQVPSGNYTANLVDGRFAFTEEQDRDYYLDGRSYNLHGAISECLDQLVMDPNKAAKWSRGSVRYEHYSLVELAKYHRSLAGARGTMMVRTYRVG